jgi:hypothetical protein
MDQVLENHPGDPRLDGKSGTFRATATGAIVEPAGDCRVYYYPETGKPPFNNKQRR